MITRHSVHEWLLAYMNREIDAVHLAKWAQMALNEGRIYPEDEDDVRHVLIHLRRLDIRAWGLTWDELYDLLEYLGYEIQVTAEPIHDEDEVSLPPNDLLDPGRFDSATLW